MIKIPTVAHSSARDDTSGSPPSASRYASNAVSTYTTTASPRGRRGTRSLRPRPACTPDEAEHRRGDQQHREEHAAREPVHLATGDHAVTEPREDQRAPERRARIDRGARRLLSHQRRRTASPHIAQTSSSIGLLAFADRTRPHRDRAARRASIRRPPAGPSATVGHDGSATATAGSELEVGLRVRLGLGARAPAATGSKHMPHHAAPSVDHGAAVRQQRSSSSEGVSAMPASVPPAPRRTEEATLSATASRSQPTSRSAIAGHACARSTRSRPAAPIGARALGVGRAARRRRRRPGPTSLPSTRRPGLAVDHGLARAARIAHDDRAAAGRRLDEHVAPALDLEAAEPRAARHREHVAHRVVARAGPPRTPAPRRPPTRRARRAASAAELVLVRAAAHDHQRRVRHPPADRRHPLDQHVLALAGDQPADAHDQRPLADPVAARGGRPSAGPAGTPRGRRPGTGSTPGPRPARRCARSAR